MKESGHRLTSVVLFVVLTTSENYREQAKEGANYRVAKNLYL
jgi:hypothetical protein